MKFPSFWTSDDQTITGRLQKQRVAVAWSLGALAFIFVVTLVADYLISDRRDTAVGLRKAVQDISIGMLQAQTREKDFQMHRLETDITAQATDAKAALEATARAIALAAGDDEALPMLQALEKRQKAYQEQFGRFVETNRELGLDEAHGLEGKFRDSVHAVEAVVRETHQDSLVISMLQLRRHEKDFINRVRDEYLVKHKDEMGNFRRLLANSALGAANKEKVATQIDNYEHTFADYVDGRKRMEKELALARETSEAMVPLTAGLVERQNQVAADSELTAAIATRTLAAVQLVLLALVAVGVTVALRRTALAINEPLAQLTETVDRLAGGDTSARSNIRSEDEFGAFGAQLDRMLDEREAVAAGIASENEQLNQSVLSLLQAVAQISRKDLTIKVPVTTDVTGPVADALNLLTGETARVLQQVSNISADVAEASLKVQQQSDTVMNVAEQERRQVDQTAESLDAASRAMTTIAELAQTCNQAADRAIRTTEQALQAVQSTAGGINSTRETIRETEKRIKRLGERSQEISVAVNLINSIAERTHILALNAAMHAASAGEAGRGFAVVADEVQRLAENARQATQQIATLVGNIQLETADTVNTMNSAISQVVEGSRLAEHAGQQMQATQVSTAELVASVQRIATQSQEQARSSENLRDQAVLIKRSTEQTSRELTEQGEQTVRLVEYARGLLAAVRVFKLSAS